MSDYSRHKNFYSIVGPATKSWLQSKFNYHCTKYKHQEDWPYIVLSNHNTDYDPLLLRQTFQDHMYFVAADNILRMGLASKAIVRYCKPIFRVKGKQEIRTTSEILKTVRAGHNVCIFAEGNRSFNGVTGYIYPATGKVVKKAGGGLITYRMSGGYLTSPRWSKVIRRGRMDGEIVGVYSPDELASLTAEEIHEIIVRDLHEDAYERQEANPIAYKGKDLAEGLESTLFTCPKCECIGSLSSQGDFVRCECGYCARYDEFGYLVTEDGGRSSIKDLDRWQLNLLEEKIKSMEDDSNTPLFSDENVVIKAIGTEHEIVREDVGTITAYTDRLTIMTEGIDYVFRFEQFAGMSIFSSNKIVFNYKDGDLNQFEIHGPESYSALKYLYLYKNTAVVV